MMALAERILVPWTQIRRKFWGPTKSMAHDGILHSQTILKVPTKQVTLAMEHALSIPCPDLTDEDRDHDFHQKRGLGFARQEDWAGLSQAIASAEETRAKTTGGMPVAELLAFGARTDVVGLVEHALITGKPDRDAPIMEGIEALEDVLSDHSDDAIIASIIAQAHMDIGWAWRGTGADILVPVHNREAFDAHFERAADILAGFDQNNIKIPLFAATRCALNAGLSAPVEKIVADYETWLKLDPHNARVLRAMGNHLLPRWHGTYDRLEIEARRAASKTAYIWGAGGYTWTMFDAISSDAKACARLDLRLFCDGLIDIVRHCPDQYTVNLLAAYCASTIGAMPTGQGEADYVRAQIAAAAKWLIIDHMTELQPMVWANAARGFDNALKVRCPKRYAASGHADARRFLVNLFHSELAVGHEVLFTEKGAKTRMA